MANLPVEAGVLSFTFSSLFLYVDYPACTSSRVYVRWLYISVNEIREGNYGNFSLRPTTPP